MIQNGRQKGKGFWGAGNAQLRVDKMLFQSSLLNYSGKHDKKRSPPITKALRARQLGTRNDTELYRDL